MNHLDRQRCYFGAHALLARASGDFDLAQRFDEYVFSDSVPRDLPRGMPAAQFEALSGVVSREQAEAAVQMAFSGAGLAEASR